MGFDMYWLEKPDGEDEAVAAARAAFDEAVRVRDSQYPSRVGGGLTVAERETLMASPEQQAVLEASAEVDRVRRSYCRRNVRGMSETLDALSALGLTDGSWGDQGAWPRHQEFGLDDSTVNAYYEVLLGDEDEDELAADAPEAVRQFDRALRAHRDRETGGLLPVWKFGSNDGWLVTPGECRRAYAAWRALELQRVYIGSEEERSAPRQILFALDAWGDDFGPDAATAWLVEFLDWVGEAAAHGGFRVY